MTDDDITCTACTETHCLNDYLAPKLKKLFIVYVIVMIDVRLEY